MNYNGTDYIHNDTSGGWFSWAGGSLVAILDGSLVAILDALWYGW